MADAALIDGHEKGSREVLSRLACRDGRRGPDRWTRDLSLSVRTLVHGRDGRRGPDRWTHVALALRGPVAAAAMADAALIDGHPRRWSPRQRLSAAMADAALIDGHDVPGRVPLYAHTAAMADAALIDGHRGVLMMYGVQQGRDGRRGPDRRTLTKSLS